MMYWHSKEQNGMTFCKNLNAAKKLRKRKHKLEIKRELVPMKNIVRNNNHLPKNNVAHLKTAIGQF
eukprot:9061060-Ditylum_brightwellii.AAC.1